MFQHQKSYNGIPPSSSSPASRTNVIKGDPDTDYLGTNPDNSTSAWKEGFRSNTSAQAEYEHNGKKEHKEYPHPVIQVFQAPIRLLKADQEWKALAGAKFDLYRDAYDASGTEGAKVENAKNLLKTGLVSEISGEGEKRTAQISVEKLKPGTYYLVETEAPAGYNRLDPVRIEVTVTTTVTGESTTDTVGVKAYLGESLLSENLSRPDGTGAWTLTLVNTSGYELPSTGGPGVMLYCLLGSMLTGLAGVGLMLRRRGDGSVL